MSEKLIKLERKNSGSEYNSSFEDKWKGGVLKKVSLSKDKDEIIFCVDEEKFSLYTEFRREDFNILFEDINKNIGEPIKEFSFSVSRPSNVDCDTGSVSSQTLSYFVIIFKNKKECLIDANSALAQTFKFKKV
ncbi:MAG: hypothetical protein WCO35_01760 [Candidatus Nomurabacteria bacterium]